MPAGAQPFAIAVGLIIVSAIVSSLSSRRLIAKIDQLQIALDDRNQLVRLANWYSDSTQVLAIFVPPVVGLALGVAWGSGLLQLVYWVVIAITLLTLFHFAMGEPLEYGVRITSKCPLTRLGLIGLIVNAVALVVTWLAPVQG